jgi:ketosteroid isomerase-like protein
MMASGPNIDCVLAFYAALNEGDEQAIANHLSEDATQYYTRLSPHQGAGTIARYAAWAVDKLEASWRVENAIEQDGEVAVEWTMTWRHPEGVLRLNRGSEWFRFNGDRIAEVRANHHGSRRNPQGDLLGFDHADRGHTTLEQ